MSDIESLPEIQADDKILTLLSAVALDRFPDVDPLYTVLLEWRREVDSVPMPTDPLAFA